ncbi:MAG: HAMP domain-containing histidine kinase [Christensenellaceae bacterium]|jgi:two-component system sensor kinase Ihk|nr:HAMP domain-containing histidine kinase [Christensenellaceae bacterium]
MSRKRSIVGTTFLFASLLIVLAVSLTLAALYFAMPKYYLYKKNQALQTNLNVLVDDLRGTENAEESAALIAAFSEANNAEITALNRENKPIPTLSTPYVALEDAEAGGGFSITVDSGSDYQDSVYSTTVEGVAFQGGGGGGFATQTIMLSVPVGSKLVESISVSSTLQPINEAKSVILSLIPYLLLGNILPGLGLAFFYAKRFTSPILHLSEAAVRMERMEPGAVSGLRTQDELGQLSRNLDALYASLGENIHSLNDEMAKVSRMERAKTQLMQSASHELKTPIAALNGIVEGMLDNVGVYRDRDTYLKECKGLINRLALLVGEILTASRSDIEADALSFTQVNPAELLEQALAANALLLKSRGVIITKRLGNHTLFTDEAILHRALSNLISNAARYTLPGGELYLTLAEEDSGWALSIENQCEPIPPEELEKLTEPFYTRSYSRDKTISGTGLGLYIVRRSLEQLAIPWGMEATALGLKVRLKL